jgi:hypothetical protein
MMLVAQDYPRFKRGEMEALQQRALETALSGLV